MKEEIELTIYQVCEAAKGADPHLNVHSALGEVEIEGNEYQMQITLVCNKVDWCGENEVRFSEVVKRH